MRMHEPVHEWAKRSGMPVAYRPTSFRYKRSGPKHRAAGVREKTIEFGEPRRHRRIYSLYHTPIRDAKGNLVGAGEVSPRSPPEYSLALILSLPAVPYLDGLSALVIDDPALMPRGVHTSFTLPSRQTTLSTRVGIQNGRQ